MSRMIWWTVVSAFSFCLLCTGCGDKVEEAVTEDGSEGEEVVEELEDTPVVYEFTETNETVSVEEIEQPKYRVEADFNQDGLLDIAVAIEDSSVDIYIQKAITEEDAAQATPPEAAATGVRKMASPKAAKRPKTVYYRAGTIDRAMDGDVIGLLSRQGSEYTDLLILVKQDSGGSELIHLVNDGERFIEPDETESGVTAQSK